MKFLVESSFYYGICNEPTLFLIKDNWDDFGYKTTFSLVYSYKSLTKNIGTIKILCKRSNNTFNNIPKRFEHLNSEFCSLGQELQYYKNLMEVFPNNYIEILKALQDIAIFDEIKSNYENEEGLSSSLLRFSGAVKALAEAKGIIFNTNIDVKQLSFDFITNLSYSGSNVKLRFEFENDDFLPYRINVLIGKNGSGKTQLLTSLANCLSGYTDNRTNNEVFNGERPAFDKVMSVSYSAFDQFKKPKQPNDARKVFSYVYCGIKNEKGTLSLNELKENLKNSYGLIKEKNRITIWTDVLNVLMENQNDLEMLTQGNFETINLSSGQNILICTITDIIANIDNESIILFDEPEIHLHPNAISNVIRMFYQILEEFNSYAIFSTHSPILLQEIPSKYIQVLTRIDNILTIKKPNIETFGSNISEIVTDVFDVTEIESNYKSVLKKLSNSHSYDDIQKMFNNSLSLNALLYLQSCYYG